MHVRPKRLLSLGSVLVDIRVEVPYLPERSGDVLASSATSMTGGGFNILAAAARNGLSAAFAGQHGTGPNGDRIRADLAREGIGTLLPPNPEGDNGFCFVMVEPDGERTFVTSPGIEAYARNRSLADIAFQERDAIFVSGYDLSYPELGSAIAAWIPSISPNAVLVFDPGPLVAMIPDAVLEVVLPRVDILTMNQREATLLTGSDDLLRVFELTLPRLRPGALLIVRQGKAGCTLGGRPMADKRVAVAAPTVRMVDATGAGDAHTGVFIAGLATGLDPIVAAARANTAAALAVTRPGSATAPTAGELDAFLAASCDIA